MIVVRNVTDFGRRDLGGYVILNNGVDGIPVLDDSGTKARVWETEREALDWIAEQEEPSRCPECGGPRRRSCRS